MRRVRRTSGKEKKKKRRRKRHRFDSHSLQNNDKIDKFLSSWMFFFLLKFFRGIFFGNLYPKTAKQTKSFDAFEDQRSEHTRFAVLFASIINKNLSVAEKSA